MGRISKRKISGGKSPQNRQNSSDSGRGASSAGYRAGVYVRLSSGRGQRENSQFTIAKRYAEEWNLTHRETIEILDCYSDLGKTGRNFEREGFLRLMQDIRIGRINCVIVKDLSRLGRNYLETGDYIEKIFPFLGVRFVAVADGYDTAVPGNGDLQLNCQIKNLVNDMYAKEFSEKAKLQLRQRRKEGSYVGGPPPYGYRAQLRENEKGKRRRTLVPDEKTAEIVRFIYEKYAQTMSYTAVARALDERGINPPARYHRTGEIYRSLEEEACGGWSKSTVERILHSETYRGTLGQGKT